MISLLEWLTYWLPMIRKELNLKDDDVDILLNHRALGDQNKEKIHFGELDHEKTIVFGAGPNLEEHMANVDMDRLANRVNIIAADGATTFLLEKGIYPHIIFSDLDGELSHLIKAVNSGAIMFTLIHGDNEDKIELLLESDLKDDIQSNLMWCTQGLPIYGFKNTLGFTDGDRAALFSIQSNLPTLLVGFDLASGDIGKYSAISKNKSENYINKKKKKLKIANSILLEIQNSGNLFTIDPSKSPGNKITLAAFLKLGDDAGNISKNVDYY